MKHLLTPLLFLLFLLGCATVPEKRMVLPVDIQFANVYYGGSLNKSEIEKLPNFPEDSAQQRILMASFEKMERKLKKELEKYARKGSYNLVEREDLANIVLTLHFLPYHLQSNTLSLPLELHMKDLRSGTSQVRAFAAKGEISKKGGSRMEKDYFLFYGALLNETERAFPSDRMVMLFYPHDENSN